MEKFLNSERGWKRKFSDETVKKVENKLTLIKDQGKLDAEEPTLEKSKIDDPNEDTPNAMD